MSNEILFLAHRVPFPPNRGDKIRSHHILQRLARLAPVHVACFTDGDDGIAEEMELAAIARSYRLVRRTKPLWYAGIEALAGRAPVSCTAYRNAAIDAYVRGVLATGVVGTIYVFSGQMGQYVPDGWEGRLIMDFVDVDSAKFEAYAAHKGPLRGWVDMREARLLRAEEARLACRADVSLLVSETEAELFRTCLSPQDRACTHVRALHNGIDSDVFDPTQAVAEPRLAALPGPRLIFTGQMNYPPNIAAAMRVARRILPLIRRHLPEASFHVVGRNPVDSLLALHGHEGMYVWGGVPDMRPWLRGADMALVPLEIARGVQNKVLEAMAMALPVVLSGAAATGINAVAGHHYTIAESDTDFADAVVALAGTSYRARTMSTAARRFVVEQQGWRSALAPLTEMILGPRSQEGRKRLRDAA